MTTPREWDEAGLHWMLNEPIELHHEIGFDGHGNSWVSFPGVYVLTAREPFRPNIREFFVGRFEMTRKWLHRREKVGLWFFSVSVTEVEPDEAKDTEELRIAGRNILAEYEAWKKQRAAREMQPKGGD